MVAKLANELSSPDARRRMAALKSILDEADADSLPRIAAAVPGEPHPKVRAAMAMVLGKLGGADQAGVLARLTADPEPAVRLRAVEAIGAIRSYSCRAVLVRVLGTETVTAVRDIAAHVLIEGGKARLLALFREMVTSERAWEREAVVRTCPLFNSDNIVPLLEHAAKRDLSEAIRDSAIEGLERLAGLGNAVAARALEQARKPPVPLAVNLAAALLRSDGSDDDDAEVGASYTGGKNPKRDDDEDPFVEQAAPTPIAPTVIALPRPQPAPAPAPTPTPAPPPTPVRAPYASIDLPDFDSFISTAILIAILTSPLLLGGPALIGLFALFISIAVGLVVYWWTHRDRRIELNSRGLVLTTGKKEVVVPWAEMKDVQIRRFFKHNGPMHNTIWFRLRSGASHKLNGLESLGYLKLYELARAHLAALAGGAVVTRAVPTAELTTEHAEIEGLRPAPASRSDAPKTAPKPEPKSGPRPAAGASVTRWALGPSAMPITTWQTIQASALGLTLMGLAIGVVMALAPTPDRKHPGGGGSDIVGRLIGIGVLLAGAAGFVTLRSRFQAQNYVEGAALEADPDGLRLPGCMLLEPDQETIYVKRADVTRIWLRTVNGNLTGLHIAIRDRGTVDIPVSALNEELEQVATALRTILRVY